MNDKIRILKKLSYILVPVIIVLAIGFMSGCVKQKLTGDDDINLVKTKKAEMTGIKEADINLQAGVANKKEETTQTAKGDITTNDVKPYIIVIVGQTAIIILLTIFGYLNKRNQLKNTEKRFDRLMDAIHNNPNDSLEKIEQI